MPTMDEFLTGITQPKDPPTAPSAAENILAGSDMKPDQAAAAVAQSRRFGVPTTLLGGQPDPDLTRKAELEDVGKHLKASPTLESFLADLPPTHVAMVRDDVENMSKMDQAIHGFGDYVLRPIGGEGMGRFQQGAYGLAAAPADLLAWGIPQTKPLADALHAASAAGGQWADTYGVAAGEYSGIGRDVASGISSMWNSLLLMPLGVEQQGAQALTKLAQFALPSIKALLPMGLQTAGLEYQNATDAGLGGLKSAVYAGQQGAIEMVTEALPFGQLLHDAKAGSPFLATLGKQLLEENLGEQVATHWQDLNDWLYLHPEKSVADYLAERKDAAISTAIATTFATGLQTGLFSAAARGLRNGDRDKEAADRASQHAEILGNMAKLSDASQVRQRDLQTFEGYVESAAQGSPVENVYISANALMQSGKAEKLAQLSPTVAEQLNDAVASGGDIRIPVAEVFGRLGDNAAELLPDLKTGPNEFTAREAEAYQKDNGEALKAKVDKILQDQSGDLEFKASRDRVSAQITEQLNSIGRFTDPVNKIKGDFLAAYMSVQAAQSGMMPEEFAAKHMPTFVGSEQAGIEQSGVDFGQEAYNILEGDSLPVEYSTNKKVAKLREQYQNLLTVSDDYRSNGRGAKVDDKLNSIHMELEDLLKTSSPGDQIKSAIGNDGSFDPSNPNILKQSAHKDDAVAAEIEKELDAESDDVAEIVQDAVPESVDAGATLANALALAKGQVWQKGRDLKVAMQSAVQSLAAAAGVDVGSPSTATSDYLRRVGVKDALFALEQNPNAVGWYDVKTRQALALMALIHPEIATDEDAKLAFVWAMAVTSNGLKVDKNFEIAELAYRAYRADRKMPTNVGIGTAGKAINTALGKFNELSDAWGIDNLRKFMQTDFLVSEITGIDKSLKPGGEHADVTVRGSAILGPKIGNGFFSNLYGNFDSLTMDRWLVRTWGRWTGTLIRPMPHQTEKARVRLTAALAAVVANPADLARMSDVIGTPLTAGMSVEDLAKSIAEASMEPAARSRMNETEVGLEMRKAGNSLAKYLDGQKEAPAGPGERKYIREVFGMILSEVRSDPRYSDLTMADLQAVLWYAEKRLYETAKQDLTEDDDVEGYSDEDAPDYANAAASVARAAGVTERRINIALGKEERRGRSGDARPADGQASQGQPGQQETSGGFTKKEKRSFIGGLAVRRVRSNSQSDGPKSWTYSRKGGSDGGGVRLLKSLGVTYSAVWSLGGKAQNVFKANALGRAKFLELSKVEATDGPSNAQRFADLISESKRTSPFGGAVSVYSAEEYSAMRLFVSEDGKSGVAIKPDGDIVSVFSSGGNGHAVLELATAAGGTKLDCFETILPDFYAPHGFVATSRLTWSDPDAPPGWDKAVFSEFNNGEPDVVLMVYDPTFFGQYEHSDGRRGAGESAYTDSLRLQTAAVRRVSRGKPLAQASRGSFDPTTRTLALLAAADLSTFFHESAHYFLDLQATIASQPGAPARVVEDLDKLLQWFGVEGATPEARIATFNAARTALNDSITGTPFDPDLAAKATKWHEQMAESFEQYLREGKAPSVELQSIFQTLRAWLKWVYKTLNDMYRVTTDAKFRLNDEVRMVFDRLLATDEEIAVARAGANMNQLFETRAEAEKFGIDWENYHNLTVSDVQTAQDELAAKAVRDLKWLDNARSRMLKKLQAEGADIRKLAKAKITETVKGQPVYRAIRWLKTGEMTVDGDEIKAEKGFKLNTDAVKALFPASGLDNLEVSALRGMTNSEGLDPDLVAEMFGYTSGEQLIKDILAAQPMADVIEGMTDQKMLEDHSELSDPETMQEAVNRAIYNQAHQKVLTAELGALEKSLAGKTTNGKDKNGRDKSIRTLPKAAKEFAQQLISRVKVKDLKPARYEAAAKRAAAEATKAMKAGKLEEAATAKRNELVNNYAAEAAHEAQAKITSAEKLFRKVLTGADAKILKSRDMGLVNAARAVLSQFGFSGKARSAMPYLELVRQYDPDTYNAVESSVRAAQDNAKPFATLTIAEVEILHNEIDALWNMARRMKTMEIDGNKLDREELAIELNARLEEIGVPTNLPGQTSAITPAETRSMTFASMKAALRRVESWVDQMDGGTHAKVFRKYVWEPIKLAADRYRADKVVYLREFRAAFENIGGTMTKGLIEAPELWYTFGKDSGGVAMNEILHAILHTGNESNKRKLLVGRGWAFDNEDGTLNTGPMPDGRGGWDAFIERMTREGKLTKDHFDFAQQVWDLLEKMKPAAQEAHRDAYGKYFDEVTADSFTNKFGTYRGGYVPAMTDARIVKDMELKRLIEENKEGLAFAFPGTSKGFTQSRVKYDRPLLLDLRTLPQHIDKVLKFTHLENPVRDVSKLLGDKRVSTPLNAIQPESINGMLTPWLTRAASQQVTTPTVGAGWAAKFLNGLRNRTGMATMFANLSNTAQQITGFALAGVVVTPSHLLSATATYMGSPRKTSAFVAALSSYMDHRMSNEVDALLGEVDAILLDPSVYESAQNWSKRHQYFMQSAVDNVMGPIIWLAAYNQALEQNFNTVEAARLADASIRQTQGSTLPEDVSRAETGPALVRLFTQFSGYFNMQANLLGTGFAKIPAELGMSKKVGRGFYVGLMGFAIPAILAEAIAQAFRGGPADDDKDGEYLDDWIMALLAYGPMRNATAFVPMGGQIVNSVIGRFTNNPMDDRISTGAAVNALERAGGVPFDAYKFMIGEGKAEKTLRDVASLATLVTGLPISALVKPITYAAGIAEGSTQPTGPVDVTRGLVTGTASPASR